METKVSNFSERYIFCERNFYFQDDLFLVTWLENFHKKNYIFYIYLMSL